MRVTLFRQAAPGSRSWNLAKTAQQIVVVWGLALAAVPFLLDWIERRAGWEFLRFEAQPAAGLTMFALSSLGGLWSAWIVARQGEGTPLPLDGPRRLVVVGPYAYLRNPMAATGVGQALGVALTLGSGTVVVYSLVGGLLWQCVLRPLEEANLASRFGAPYEEYRRQVRCWIPRSSAYRPSDLDPP